MRLLTAQLESGQCKLFACLPSGLVMGVMQQHHSVLLRWAHPGLLMLNHVICCGVAQETHAC